MTLRFVCPTCAQTVTLYRPPTYPPTCGHHGTNHDARKPSEMKEEA